MATATMGGRLCEAARFVGTSTTPEGTALSTNYEHLLQPITIGNLTLPNRMVLLPMGTEMGTHEGLFTDREIAYYTERAAGGVGLVMTGIAAVSDDLEMINEGLCRVATDESLPGMQKLTDSIHAVGGRISLQLTAGLGRNINNVSPDRLPISASAVPHFSEPDVLCRPLEISEIRLLVQRMGEAAERAYKTGFDAIDIHGHTGYIIDQFMSPLWNQRTDEYGGSVENRARFAVEIIQAIKNAAPGLPVSFRISMDHKFPGGRTTEESMELAKHLEAAGLDMILADDGSYEAMDYVFPPYYLGDGCMVPAARALKGVVSIPVVACGNLDPDTGESVLAAGDADIAGIGRGLIADPELPNKLAAGRRIDIRPCIRCNSMCIGNAFFALPLGCAVNPEVGFEGQRVISAAQTPKHVVIVGAGPAGLEAARVAALEGHTVDLYDSNSRVGGVLLPAATPIFKRELHRMIDWWEAQLAGLAVKIHLNHSVEASDPIFDDAGAVLLATGSLPLVPRAIPGIDGPNVVGVIEAHEGAPLGQNIVVAGGGLSGADLALELAQSGKSVSVIEMKDEIAGDMLAINRIPLLRDLAEARVKLFTNTSVTAVDSTGVHVVDASGAEQHVDADTVITAFGVRPNGALARDLEARGVSFQSIGDCVKPAKVGEAINAGYLAAQAI